ncbi:MAG: DUF5916 domain-containing protein, partial [Gemmatimonadota bacterium]|nr:DUF5916 domain-containing protein [Gemmatimonadota bacterium]
AGGDFRDSPNTSTILGAAKVTGQLGGGWQLGTVAALTDDETARVFDLETGTVEEVEVEPRTGYGALRIQRQFGVDASTVGLTLTGVERGVEAGGALAGILTRRAYAGGIDWNRRFDGGAYELMGHVGFSHVRGDSAAIDRLQRSSVHYFQRPDQDHVDVDPGARSLSGWSAAIRGGKRSGTWRFNGGTWIDSPGFDINDLGRLSRGDEINQWGGLRYVETDPGRLFRRWVVGAFTDTGWNFDGVRRRTNGGVYFNYTLPNFWHGWIDHGRNFGGQSDTATRGGPLMERPAGWWVGFGIRGNPNASTGWGFRTFGRRDELGSWTWRVDPEVTVRPTDRLTLSLEPRWVLRRDARQFVTAVDGGPARTFGRRYVFGEIERSEVAAPVRVNYAFTPDLGLEFYAEPFAASGRYSGIGELAAPRSSDLIVYGEAAGTAIAPDPAGERFAVTADGDAFTIPDPDFEALSFRSNLVLRWEYRPGSSLFLVWQQNRSRAGSDADRVGGGELLDAFSADGENVLAVKLTWWMTP